MNFAILSAYLGSCLMTFCAGVYLGGYRGWHRRASWCERHCPLHVTSDQQPVEAEYNTRMQG
jgi:hypothetical protein